MADRLYMKKAFILITSGNLHLKKNLSFLKILLWFKTAKRIAVTSGRVDLNRLLTKDQMGHQRTGVSNTGVREQNVSMK